MPVLTPPLSLVSRAAFHFDLGTLHEVCVLDVTYHCGDLGCGHDFLPQIATVDLVALPCRLVICGAILARRHRTLLCTAHVPQYGVQAMDAEHGLRHLVSTEPG